MNELIIYNSDDGKVQVALLVADNEAWLNQGQLAELFDTSVQNIALHIKNILSDNELDENSVIKDYLITARDGKQYQVKHYALEMVLAVGFRVRSPRGVQFRRWAKKATLGRCRGLAGIGASASRFGKKKKLILFNSLVQAA